MTDEMSVDYPGRPSVGDSTEVSLLLADVSRIMNSTEFPEFNSTIFQCPDGREVKANGAFLSCRSNFFKEFLQTASAGGNVVQFNHSSSRALEMVIEYLHQCRLNRLRPTASAVEAHYLAGLCNLPGLQRLIVDYLVSHARGNARIGPTMSEALKLRACNIAELILPVVSSAMMEGRCDLFDGFSADALVFSLQHPNLRRSRPNEINILRCVLHWAIGRYEIRSLQLSPSTSSLTVNEQWTLTQSDISGLQHFFRTSSAMKQNEWLLVLGGVRFDKIPTHLIKEQIEPLGVVPIEVLIRAYCDQACRFATVALKSSLWDPDCCGSEVRIEQDRCNFQCISHQGARGQTSFVSGVHCWHISIEKYSDHVWIGVVGDGADMDHWLGKQEAGFMFGSNGTICHNTQNLMSLNTVPYAVKYRDASILKVILDMEARTLSYEVDGTNFGVAFANIPSKVYPAVSARKPSIIRISFGDRIWALVDDIYD